jgi:predicted metalloendopeptidase
MSSVDPNDFDKTIRPADDFYRYVNGGWLTKNPIPADESRWGSFYTLRFDVEQQIKKLLDEIVAKAGLVAGSDEQKVRDFYREAMDMEKRNRLGVAPLAVYFKKIDEITTINDLAYVVGEMHRAGMGAFWNAFVGQDEKQSDVMALQFWQGGLGLPDRDYYLTDDEKNKKIRADYLAYMADVLVSANMINEKAPGGLLVSEEAKERATRKIFDIEVRLAKASLTRVELRDVEKMYNKMTLAAFALIAPKVPLADYWRAVAPADPSFQPAYLIVGQPKFFAEVNEIFENVPLEDIKLYLHWQVANGTATYLTEELERRNFEFYGRTFGGAKEMKPLWRRALRATDSALDELLGKVYVARYFPEDAKKKVKDLVEHLVVAYRARIEKLDWMSDETKKKAFEKLGTVSKKLGYPDVWKDYAMLTIGTDSFVDNATRAHVAEFDRKIKEVGGPVNRNEWLMPPQLVNAYYMPPMNEIAFPAAILQPPFFDPAADDAVNFGGIGSVIGHELTHGFDDQGSLFDAKGNISQWWTKEDKEKFDAKAAHLAEQFDAYEPLPGTHINGKLTLGENIADFGGIIIAYDALKLWLAEHPGSAIDGFTPEQRFFMGYAVTERGHYRDEALRLQLQTDPHSPGEFRVNGPLSNLDEFYQAFDVKEGDKLWRKPEDRVKIW